MNADQLFETLKRDHPDVHITLYSGSTRRDDGSEYSTASCLIRPKSSDDCVVNETCCGNTGSIADREGAVEKLAGVVHEKMAAYLDLPKPPACPCCKQPMPKGVSVPATVNGKAATVEGPIR